MQLAHRSDQRGCLVEDLRWSRGSHQPGQVLLGGVVEGYDPIDRRHRGRSVANIRLALDGFAAPPGSPTPVHFNAFDVFAGLVELAHSAIALCSDDVGEYWFAAVRSLQSDATQDARRNA